MNDQPISEDYFNQERPMCPRCGVNPQRYSEDICTECYDAEWWADISSPYDPEEDLEVDED